MTLEEMEKAAKTLDDAHCPETKRYIWFNMEMYYINEQGKVFKINENHNL